jgi:DNA-binding NarL/FixJ family response regulator
MDKRIRVLVVDDECSVREAIVALLKMAAGIMVVGKADSAERCVQKAHLLRPDVILLDLHLPDKSGVEVIGALLKDNPNVCIVILTGYADDHEVALAFRAGAVGYMLKTQAPSDLARTIEDTYEGRSSVSPRIAKIMLQMMNPRKSTAAHAASGLTKGECRVLRCVAQGLTNKEIARHLHLCRSTVHVHVSHILRKLQVENRTQATLYALRTGLSSLANGLAEEG